MIRSGRAFLIQNYFKTTFRHVLKSKTNFCFKLGGLILALLSFLIIALYVSYHVSFDRYHEDYDRVYRVNAEWTIDAKRERNTAVPTALGPALKQGFPEVKSFARMQDIGQYLVKYKDNMIRFDGVVNADTSIFSVFTFKFIQGSKHALDRPGSIVLTRSIAGLIFGKVDPLHQLISFRDRYDQVFQVTGLIEDLPSNSHLNIRAIMPYNSLLDSTEVALDSWEIDRGGGLYIRFENDVQPDNFLVKVEPLLRNNLKMSSNEQKKDFRIWMQPIAEIHLSTPLIMEIAVKENKLYVVFFSILAVFVLAIASMNYINLSIADFFNRSREIGVRKILGAGKKQIAFQIMLEALFFCLLALLISIVILYMIFPAIQTQLDPHLLFIGLLDPDLIKVVLFTFFFLIVFSTAYPAYRLSMNNPASDLKQNHGVGRNSSISNKLLAIQCVISIICISATLIVRRQVEFIRTKDPGYDRHNVVAFILPDRYPPERVPVLKDELSRVPGIELVSYSYLLLGGGPYFKGWYNVEIEGEMKRMELNETFCDHDFFHLVGMQLVAGRAFDKNNPADAHTAFIVNETAMKEFGWQDPIGKRIAVVDDNATKEKWEGTVVGVMKDANILSMHQKIEPLVMRLQWDWWPGYFLYLKITGPFDETFAAAKKKYEELMPGFLVDYRLVEDRYIAQYGDENKVLAVLELGTWMIVLISSLGIFSLSAYLSVRRMKEFGIRKVLGASVGQIAFLHVSHFMRIVLVANFIAQPIAYWIMKEWLNEFAYRRDLSGVIFLSVTGISVFLVVVSAGYSSWRAGTMNPVDVIKIE